MHPKDHPWIGVDNIIVDDEGRILLIRRSEQEKNFPGMWALVSGKIEWGGTVQEALKREAAEKVGVDVDIIRFTGRYYDAHNRHPTKTMICLPHICKIKSGTPRANDPEEVADVRWFAPKEIQKLDMAYDHKQILQDEGLI